MNYLAEIAAQIRALVPDDLVPDDSDELFLIYATLARCLGTTTSAENVHDAWTAWMSMRHTEHDSMVPFSELSEAVKREDEPFAEAIRRVAAAQGGHPEP